MLKGKFLLLGTNLGDRWGNLDRCRDLIEDTIGEIVTASLIYETAAWGITDQPSYLNQVLQIESNLSPLDLLTAALAVEKKLGRVRKERWGERIIDIDILYYDQQVVNLPDLTIPHPEISNRRFTLVPLAELIPDFIDPQKNLSIRQLLQACHDQTEVIVALKHEPDR